MKKVILFLLGLIGTIYLFLCVAIYFYQEKLIFFPDKIAKNYKFEFKEHFEELNFHTNDNLYLNGVLFKSDSSKGLIFYLHGNAGSLKSWGNVAETYIHLHYDVFMLDYRGYGKSEGDISSENQFYEDLQLVYENLKSRYDENKIIVLGYSIGTGPAARLASTNHPRLLILQAPYYSLVELAKQQFPIIPTTILLKYKFETNKFLKVCQMPVVIFHGNNDEVINYESSLKLQESFKANDKLITLNGQGHNRMSDNSEYLARIQNVLEIK